MKSVDETTEEVRQSIIATKGKKNFTKDFDGEVFELTAAMLVKKQDKPQEISETAGVAECILQKYAKVLSV